MTKATQRNPDLTDEQKKVLLHGATEAPFSGALLHVNANGMYSCANCGAELFSSDAKFDSGSGWPSFYQPTKKDAVMLVADDSYGMSRTEVRCKQCGAHLGHVFDDAHDQPTGKRYCINSVCLGFEEKHT